MSLQHLSPLESAVLAAFHELYKERGFPAPTTIGLRRRENTGAGRFVDLLTEGESQLEDGYLDLGGRYIEMEGVPHGLMAVVWIRNRRIDQLEIAVYGDDPWDGEERSWSIV